MLLLVSNPYIQSKNFLSQLGFEFGLYGLEASVQTALPEASFSKNYYATRLNDNSTSVMSCQKYLLE